MKTFFTKLRNIFAVISGIAVIIYVIRLFKNTAPVNSEFPLAEAKKEAEKQVEEDKAAIDKLGQKEYSDDEIEKRFNK